MSWHVKIFVNGIAALQGGGVTYLNQFIKEIGHYPEVEVDIYGFVKAEASYPSNVSIIDVPLAHKNYFSRWLVEKLFFAWILYIRKYDIAFFPNGIITSPSPGSVRRITMFRNMIPFDDVAKSYFCRNKNLRYWLLKRLYLKSYRISDHVIFISNYARDVVSKHLPAIFHKSSIIPHGVNHQFEVDVPLPKEKILLYVSIMNEYKHQVELVEGLALYKKTYGSCPKLKLVGYRTEYIEKVKEAISRCQLESEVELTGPLSHHDIQQQFEQSRLLIFASSCENCPNILLEAMASGRPILCSSIMPMPEFLGEGGLYFNPKDPEDFAVKLATCIDNDSLLEKEAERSKELSRQYSWRSAILKTMTLFLQLEES